MSIFKPHYKARRGYHAGWDGYYTYYKARIMVNGRVHYLGHFQTPQEATEAYRKAKLKYKK